MSDTPMTDLYMGRAEDLDFGAGWGGEVYHGFKYGGGMYSSFCMREKLHQLRLAITAYEEKDISPVRQPCKLCLAALQKAKKGEESDEPGNLSDD